MRSLWKGAISFGLVNIPVKLYAATERKDIRFNYLHRQCNTPIRYEKHCPTCNKPVDQEEIVRGYEFEKGRYVIIEDEDIESVAVEATKTVDIVDFVDLRQIDPVYFDKTYYLEPAETGGKPYQLLKKALEETNKIAVAKVVIRSKQVLAVIRVYGQALAMETIFFPDEIRQVGQLSLAGDTRLNEQELSMAVSLVNSLASDFNPEKYNNEYREAILELIHQKAQGEEIRPVSPEPTTGRVVDLMAALEASLKAAEEQKAKRANTAEPQRITR